MLAERSETIGEATNNVAEYRALLLGIELAKELGADEAEFIADSKLIVEQVRGNWKVKQEHLRPLHTKVRDDLRDLGKWSIRHVKRDDNARADELLTEALDAGAGRARRLGPTHARPASRAEDRRDHVRVEGLLIRNGAGRSLKSAPGG